MYLYCSVCKKSITKGVFDYSKDRFGKALCMDHQNPGTKMKPSGKKSDRPFVDPDLDYKGVKEKFKDRGVYELKRYHPNKIDELFGVACVYLLFDENDEVIYVGETHDLENRFAEGHKVEGKFHRISIVEFKNRHRDDWDKRRRQREKLEKALIKAYRPRFNIEHNPDREG